MSAAVSRSSLFGPPLVLEGEDSAAYDELLGRVYAAVKPADIIDEILISDAVALEWEVLRWRRLKFSLVRSHAREGLTEFLGKHLEYSLYREQFTEDLTQFLENTFPADHAKEARGSWRGTVLGTRRTRWIRLMGFWPAHGIISITS